MSVIKDVIASVDQKEQKAAEIKETLNLLNNYATEKAKIFEDTIDTSLRTAGTVENKTVPVTVKLASHQEIRVITKDTPDEDITSNIRDVLKDVLSGSKDEVIDGLKGLIDTALRAILGTGEGDERQDSTYYIATDGLAIVRLDLMYWCRHVTASSITTYAEKSLVCTAVKSSVDVAKIDLNAFLATYNAQLSKCQIPAEQVKEEIKNAKDIYELLTGGPNVQATPLPFQIQECGLIKSVTNKVEGVWPA